MNAERGLVVVTGAGRGIGAAAVVALAERGFTVVATARREEPVKALAEELAGRGLSCRAAALDVNAPESIAELADALKAEDAPVEAVVNNAGVLGPIGSLMEAEDAQWAAVMNTNLLGPFRCIRAFAPLFPEAERAAIVNVSSGAATRYVEGWS